VNRIIRIISAVCVSVVIGSGAISTEALAQAAEPEDSLDFLMESSESEDSAAEPPAKPAEPAAPPAKSADAAPGDAQPYAEVIALPQPEQATPAPKTRRPKALVEEIIVTAQRREERAQDVPISITVFDQAQLANANVNDASDLVKYTPSLTANARQGTDNSTFAIRGFTQELRTTASVGVYFAEVIAPRGQYTQPSGDGAGPGDFFDLQNVQVLKGPQGTLFGRNTTGGAVLIVPRKPTDVFEGYAEASGGNFAARRGQAVLNVPVADWFKLRLGIDHNEREGHLNNVTDIGADRLANVDFTAGRLSLLVNLTDNLENYSILSFVNSDNNGSARRVFACNPNADPRENPFYAFTGRQCQEQLANQAASGQDGYYDLVSTVATPVTAIKQRRLINTTTWQATDELTLKNVFAFTRLHTQNGQDVFGTQFRQAYDPEPAREFKVGISVLNPDFPVTSQDTLVEELQLQGRSFDAALEWQTGAYYEHSMPNGVSGNTSAALISCEMASLEGDPSQFNCFDPTNGRLGSALVTALKTNYYNKAVYGQATYHVLEQLSVTAGLRYTWDRTKSHGVKTRYTFAGNVPLGPMAVTATPMVESDAPTGMLDVSYRPMDDVMAYAKYVRGYRQGSVNVAADPGIDTWEPEHVNTFEIGSKTSFEGPAPGRFNVAVFYNDFSDQQLQVGYVSPTAGPTTAVFNAGKSRIMGVEAEAFFRLFDDFTLSLAYSHLDTKLLEQEDHMAKVEAAGGPIAGLTYSPAAEQGETLPYAPDHTFVSSLGYTLPLREELGVVDLGATYVYIGKQRAVASSSSPYAVLDAYTLLNLNLNWKTMFGLPLDLSVFATNVLDEEYVTFIGGSYNALGFEARGMGLPRMIGTRLKYHFGAAAP